MTDMSVDEPVLDEAGSDDQDDEASEEPRRRRGRPRKPVRSTDDVLAEGGEGKEMTLDQLDAVSTLERGLPKPAENVKTLSEMLSKYGIGANPDFQLALWRTSPKFWQNVKIDGFYGRYDSPLSEEFISNTYGGGVFSVRVEGPHPSKAGHRKHYDSIPLNLPGDPILDNLPHKTDAGGPAAPVAAVAAAESPKAVETALTVLSKAVENEREDRKAAENRSNTDSHVLDKVVEAHERRADDAKTAAAERERLARESSDKLLAYERDRANRLEEKLEELTTMMQQPRQTAAAELGDLLKVFPQKTDDSAVHLAESTIKDMQQRHSEDMKRVSDNHASMIEAMRASHNEEKRILHDAQQREIASERAEGRRREERLEDQLKQEREERRKDQERQREQLDANDRSWKERLESADRAWKERMEQQKSMMEMSFDSRRQSTEQNYENRIQFLQAELDRAKQDSADLRARGFEQSDPLAVIEKHRQLSEALGVTPGGSGGGGGQGGGVGLSGDGEGAWKSMLAEGALDRLPLILETVSNMVKGNAGNGQPAQQQRPPQEGDVINENGVEYVIVKHNGQLHRARRDQFEAHQAALRQRQGGGRGLPSGGEPGRRASRTAGPRRRRPEPSPMPVPNLGLGLTTPASGGVDDSVRDSMRRASEASLAGAGLPQQQQVQPQQPQPQQEPVPLTERRRSRPRQEEAQQQVEPSDGGAMRMQSGERQALAFVAKWVHEAVSQGDTEEEFCTKLNATVAPNLIKQVVTNYDPDAIAKAIVALQPNSAGATPAGQKFVHKAFALLREQYS